MDHLQKASFFFFPRPVFLTIENNTNFDDPGSFAAQCKPSLEKVLLCALKLSGLDGITIVE